jgi:hypothetical protein
MRLGFKLHDDLRTDPVDALIVDDTYQIGNPAAKEI